MDPGTVDVYEQGAQLYADDRRAYHPERASRFAAALAPGALRLDLGAGPGHYLPHLGAPVVAADAAVAMAAQVRRRSGTPPVVCDLERLPFRRGAFAGAWANKCLQHVAAEHLPLTLAGLHRMLEVDGLLDLTVFAGEGTWRTPDDDDLPGRLFTLWQPGPLHRLLVGAGFDVEEVEAHDPLGTDTSAAAHPGAGGPARLTAVARRARTLPDTVGPGMSLLVCGLNPSIYAADAGVGFARPGNRFWPAARAAGLVTADRDADAAVRDHGVGMTDLVKRATAAAAELRPDEYRAGLERVRYLVEWLRPGAVCFVGLAGWRAAVARRATPGRQDDLPGGVPVYVMPSTSGLNARTSLEELTGHLRAAAALAGR